MIAPLLCTIELHSQGIHVEPRHHAYKVPSNTEIIGVFRIESPKKYRFPLTKDHISQIAMVISHYQCRYQLKEIQIDFDAAISERDFYKNLLFYLRRILPGATKISITGLASWFVFDRWWKTLPINEIVFMFYNLPSREKLFYQKHLNNKDLYEQPFKVSIGVAQQNAFKISPYAYRVFWWGQTP